MNLNTDEQSASPAPDDGDREWKRALRIWTFILISALIAPVIAYHFFGPGWAFGVALAFFPLWFAVGPRPYLNGIGYELVGIGGLLVILPSAAVWLLMCSHSIHRYVELMRHNQ